MKRLFAMLLLRAKANRCGELATEFQGWNKVAKHGNPRLVGAIMKHSVDFQ